MRQALNARTRDGANPSSSASPAPARRSPPARSSLSPAARASPRQRRGRTDVAIADWYMDGKIEIDPMITRAGLEEINKGFDLMHEGESIRSVVVY